MLNFLQRFGIFCFLDNNEYDFDKSYDCIAGAGVIQSILSKPTSSLKEIDKFIEVQQDWIFAHLTYDVKNKIEDLHSANPDKIQFPEYLLFVPEIVFILNKNELQIGACKKNPDEIYKAIISSPISKIKKETVPVLQSRFTKEEYIDTVKKLQQHILRGDCYEINFCQEFYANEAVINPLNVYKKLNKISPNPFSAFYKYNNKYLVCASPERFLKKTGNTIFSQPIKGTAKRIFSNVKKDETEKEKLFNSEKERSENIMIVDLVRNDLTKICIEGSVFVKDFLKIYSFPQVHQMISTITGTLKKNVSIADIFSATFPMGSMTGAPKKRVMELIEKYERTRRGLFSGTVGYINPDGDFDFNVVIRSLLYNQSNHYLSLQAGAAITFKSDAKKEYEECLLKITAMQQALE